MKYGYKVTGNGLYIPWFDNGNGPQDFTSKNVQGIFRNVAHSLGNLSAPRRWDEGQWLLDPRDKKIPQEDHVVFYTSPIYVHAFLVAAKHWFDQFKSVEV